MNKSTQINQIAHQLIGQGDFSCVDAAFSTEYVVHAGNKTHKGHKFIKQFTKQVRTAIPDIKIVKIEILAQTEETIIWQRTLSGTHKANLKGIPASNKKIRCYEIVVSRFENNKIVEEWIASDLAFQLMLKQR